MVGGAEQSQEYLRLGRLRHSIHHPPIVNFSLLYEEKFKHLGLDNEMIVLA